MPATLSGHAHAESPSIVHTLHTSHSHSMTAESVPHSNSPMEQVAQSGSARGPTTSNRNAAVATTPVTQSQNAQGTHSKQNGQEVNKRSLDYIARSGLAGGLAGCAAKTVVAPLDRVKILFQASNPQFAKYTGSWTGLAAAIRDIKRHEGGRGLFKGHSATLLRIFPYAAIKFLAYEQIRAVIIPSRDKETPGRRLLSGSLAGITSVFFTYPLELIRVRLAFETKKSSRSTLRGVFRHIYQERVSPPSTSSGVAASSATGAAATATVENVSSSVNKVVPSSGIANFYRGFVPTMLGMLPYAGISFLVHDTVGDWLRLPSVSSYTTIPHSELTPAQQQTTKALRRPQLTASAELFSGAIAGLVSQTASYPFEVIRRRMQVGGVVGDGHRLGILETARTIRLERGFRGFFIGLTIGYIKVMPMAATGFFVYERLKWSLGI